MSDAEFLRFCQDNRDLNIERNAQREIIIMSPTYAKTGFYNGRLFFQIAAWNEQSQAGIAFELVGWVYPARWLGALTRRIMDAVGQVERPDKG